MRIERRDGHTAVFVTRNDGDTYRALMDDDDADSALETGTLSVMPTPNGTYVRIRHSGADGKSRMSLLHRWIMDPPRDMEVDHINHDPLDNRRCNLEVVTPQENAQRRRGWRSSTTGIKNVYLDPHGKYFVTISRHGFRSIDEAQRVAEIAREAIQAA